MGSTGKNIQIFRRNKELLPDSAIKDLKSSIKGEVIIKGETADEIYRDAINRWNKAWVQEADMIINVASEEDVSAALLYIQKWDLSITIVCGGHSFHGASSITGGVVIDMKLMNKVKIDWEGETISAQGGCRARDLEKPLAERGYTVVMGAVNDTGIGGLTLGGGTGFLTGKHGMAIDSLLAATVVLANGSVVEASEKTNPDLFWGIRGGGSNFGVVTKFIFKIHKQGQVFCGPMAFAPDKMRAVLELLINSFIKTIDSLDGKLAIFLILGKLPNMPRVHPLTLVFYDGPEDEAKKVLAPLYDLEPFFVGAKMIDYVQVTEPEHGALEKDQYITATGVVVPSSLEIEVIETVANDLDELMNKYGVPVADSRCYLELRSYRKSSAVDSSATAYWSRASGLMMALEVSYDESIPLKDIRPDTKAIIDKVRAAVKSKGPGAGELFNANLGGGMDKAQEMFGGNYSKLRELKKKYDPGFVFDKWYPIQPAE